MPTSSPAWANRSRCGMWIDYALAPGEGRSAQWTILCSKCSLRELCAPCCGLTGSERETVDRLALKRLRLRSGECLYRSGERFTSLYAIRNGSFKSAVPLYNGRSQVTGFSMAGEILGLDGIGQERHGCNAVALEDSDVRAISFAGLQELVHEMPSLQRDLRNALSREMLRQHRVMLLLGSMYAEERLAIFLLDLAKRFAARGYSTTEFNLRMKREEIGSFLGLKVETISRVFSKFQGEGLLDVRHRFIRIRDGTGLERVVGRQTEKSCARSGERQGIGWLE